MTLSAGNPESPSPQAEPVPPLVRLRADHTVSRKKIDPHALKVLYRLVNAGHKAYLVGGGVRDLLLGRSPKDFDIATDARPGQIKRLFRNCWLIGRRFRLAHIKFGDTVIETSTFRKSPVPDEPAEENGQEFLVQEDNTFGTAEEDAFRRDFTINALFYDITSFSVIDYVGGIADIERKRIRAIGDPDVRFQEDPVRMLRAVRFAARLGFTIELKTREALLRHVAELAKASRPRLYEEVQRLFGYGSSEAAFRLLRETGLLPQVFPCIDRHLDPSGPEETERFWSYLRLLDGEIRARNEVRPDLLFSTLLYPLLRRAVREQHLPAPTHALVREVTGWLSDRFTVSRRLRDGVGQILMSQVRLQEITKRRYKKSAFLRRSHFKDAMTLYRFAVEIERLDPERLSDWSRYAEGQSIGTTAAGEAHGIGDRDRKAAPRRRRKKRPGSLSRGEKTPSGGADVPPSPAPPSPGAVSGVDAASEPAQGETETSGKEEKPSRSVKKRSWAQRRRKKTAILRRQKTTPAESVPLPAPPETAIPPKEALPPPDALPETNRAGRSKRSRRNKKHAPPLSPPETPREAGAPLSA
ncbi:MAG: polynucleotide adenylyltransferase PcnB, partial [Planctomycetota bacterium]